MKDFKQQILNLESDNLESIDVPVECLGLTFPNDEERRNYFLKKLREGLEELHAKLGGVSSPRWKTRFPVSSRLSIGRLEMTNG